jgi:hypothetical protein
MGCHHHHHHHTCVEPARLSQFRSGYALPAKVIPALPNIAPVTQRRQDHQQQAAQGLVDASTSWFN